jgi:hypothetical protein
MKNYCIENPNGQDMVTCLLKKEEFILQIKTKISIIVPNSKSPKLIIYVLEGAMRMTG